MDDEDGERQPKKVYSKDTNSVILEPKEKKVRDLLNDLQNVSILSSIILPAFSLWTIWKG